MIIQTFKNIVLFWVMKKVFEVFPMQNLLRCLPKATRECKPYFEVTVAIGLNVLETLITCLKYIQNFKIIIILSILKLSLFLHTLLPNVRPGFCSLVQVATSQAENSYLLKRVLIEYIIE